MTPKVPFPAETCQIVGNPSGTNLHKALSISNDAQIIDPQGGTKDLVPKGLRVRVPSRAPLFEVQRVTADNVVLGVGELFSRVHQMCTFPDLLKVGCFMFSVCQLRALAA